MLVNIQHCAKEGPLEVNDTAILGSFKTVFNSCQRAWNIIPNFIESRRKCRMTYRNCAMITQCIKKNNRLLIKIEGKTFTERQCEFGQRTGSISLTPVIVPIYLSSNICQYHTKKNENSIIAGWIMPSSFLHVHNKHFSTFCWNTKLARWGARER